jgi:hypothetical protein
MQLFCGLLPSKSIPMASINIILDTRRARKDQTDPVILRVTQNGKSIYLRKMEHPPLAVLIGRPPWTRVQVKERCIVLAVANYWMF